MSRLTISMNVLAVAILITVATAANADTLAVRCGGKVGLTSIGSAVRLLQGESAGGPNRITVSGACLENVLIQNMNLLTISGTNGASITDASGGAADVVDIRNSSVTITGMAIDGQSGINNDAVDCEQGSHCTLVGNTIIGAADSVGVYALSSALVVGGTLQGGTFSGIFARGDVAASGVLITGTPVGIMVLKGGRMVATVADPASVAIGSLTQTNVVNSGGAGVTVSEGALFQCSGCVIRNNSGDGIDADVSAVVIVQPAFLLNGTRVLPSVRNNVGVGVSLGDLTSGSFHGPALPIAVFGNAQPDIVCRSALTVSRGALAAAGGAMHTNCAN